MENENVNAPQHSDEAPSVASAKEELKRESSENQLILIDILSNLGLVLSSTHTISNFSSEVNISELSGHDVIEMKKIETISPMFISFTDTFNVSHYVCHKLDGRVSFSTQLDYISARVAELKSEMALSSTYMKEPSRLVYENRRVYDPEALGFCANIFNFSTASDVTGRQAIEGLCVPIATMNVARTKCLDYVPRAQCREELLSMVRSRTRSTMEPYQRVETVVRARRGMLAVNFPGPKQHVYFHPNVPFNNLLRKLLDDFSYSSHLRVTLLTKMIVPKIDMTSIDSNSLLKSGKMSISKSNFCTNIVNKIYKSEMATEISAWLLSLIFPGEVIISLTFDDSEGRTELNGVLSLLAKALFMHNPLTGYTNISTESAKRVESYIAQWFIAQGRAKLMASTPYALDGIESAEGSSDWIQSLRTDSRGGGWMNSNLPTDATNDELLSQFGDIHRRINYVVNLSDMNRYESNRMVDSPIHTAILAAIGKLRLPDWKGITHAMLEAQKGFFVSINDYLSTEWYSTLRSSHAKFTAKTAEQREASAIHITISSETLMYMMKSLRPQKINPPLLTVDRLRLEGALMREAFDLSMYYELIRREIDRQGNSDHYSQSDRIRMLSAYSSGVFKWLMDSVTIFNEGDVMLRYLTMLVSQNDPYLDVWIPLRDRTPMQMIPKGLIPSVVYSLKFNWIGPEVIRHAIRNHELITNQYTGELPTDDRTAVQSDMVVVRLSDVQNYVSRRSLKSIMFDSGSKPILFDFPFQYSYQHSISASTGEDIIVHHNDGEYSIAKSVSRGTVPVCSIAVDENQFNYPDDYTPKAYNFCALWTDPRYHGMIMMRRSDFMSKIGRYSSTISLFPDPTLDLRSPFSSAE